MTMVLKCIDIHRDEGRAGIHPKLGHVGLR